MTVMLDKGTPVYLRLRDCISASILTGQYHDGDLLPSVRAFAAEHGANPLTVAKAYHSFQEDGLVVVKRGIGMFVAEGATARLMIEGRKRFLEEYWPRVREMMDLLDIDPQEMLARELA